MRVLDSPPRERRPGVAGRRWQALAGRRDVWVRALLPALLAAHQRKSSVHQKFLSLLITTLEKVHFGEAGRDQTELDGPPPPGSSKEIFCF
eukprot:COSAG04_NODE_1_length_58448_cov_23.476478_5_plen_91_part_00